MKLSIVIPAHNEENCIANTLTFLHETLLDEKINHEIILVNDHSSDKTVENAKNLSISSLKVINNKYKQGFGLAVRSGLEIATGDVVCIFMADASDSPIDVVRFFRAIEYYDVDCVFGTRFSKFSKVTGYPIFKLILNRIVNKFIQVLFKIQYNDITNAFKMYKSDVISGIQPILSHHFNLTVELPLKAIIRGFSYVVLSNDWTQRKSGISKLKIKEMGSRYLFIILYCLLEKWLSRGDYRKTQVQKEYPEPVKRKLAI